MAAILSQPQYVTGAIVGRWIEGYRYNIERLQAVLYQTLNCGGFRWQKKLKNSLLNKMWSMTIYLWTYGTIVYRLHWKPELVMMSTLSSLVTQEVAIMTNYGATNDKKISIMVMSMLSVSLIARFMGPTWGPPGSCRPQMGPMLAPRTLLSGIWSYKITWEPSQMWARPWHWRAGNYIFLLCDMPLPFLQMCLSDCQWLFWIQMTGKGQMGSDNNGPFTNMV